MDMKCQKSMTYEIEINIENELGVFEPRDDVAGHILIKAEEDTEIDSCILWLYGLTKTRWNVQSENHTTQPGSLASGINLLRSTSNFKRLNNSTATYITENKFCKLLSNASSVLRKTTTSKLQDNSSFRLPLRTCCTDQGYLSDTHYKSSCNYNHSSCFLDHEINGETRIGGSWISGSGSFNSSLDAESSIRSFHSLGKFGYPSGANNFADFSFRSSQQFTMRNQLYDAGCLPSFCLEQWRKLFEVDPDKKKCLYNGDLQLIYKSKLDLLKQHQQYLSGKSKDKGDNSTRDGTTEILKVIHHDNGNEDNLDKSYNDKESSSEPINSEEKMNRGSSQRYQHNTGTKYYELMNMTNEKSQTSAEKNIKLKPKFILTRGIHVFDFEFQLPADLPGSFELPSNCLAGGASASITYAVRIEIYSNRSKMKHVQQREIIVFRPLELIHFPRLRDRITLHREFVSLGCCSNPSGIIQCDLAVNKTGFVPGETIIPQVHITNRSSRAIQTVHLTFAQTVFLKGVNNQSHFEVLRIFATKLNAQPAALGFDLFDQLDVNSLGGLFSPSNSFSSRSSANRVDRIQQQHPHQQQEHQLCNVNAKQHSKDAESHSNQRQKSRKRHQHHSSSTNVVAVPSQGGKAFFTDLIHVPPLPTSGLFGRQSLIYLEYSLILRLRMQGDKEGKHDHCMQIPITIGSDPTRETSFTGNNEVVPCYASFNFASGDIVEYDPSDQTTATSLTPVYRYFKPKPIEKPVNRSNITFSSESPVNSNSIKSVQITSKSSPSILKTPGTSGVPTGTGTGANTTRNNRQNSFKSNKSLCDNENLPQVPRNFHRQQDKHLKNTAGSPDMNKASFTTLYNSDGAKSDSCSYKQTQNKIRKHTSSYKLKHQNNFQDVTPQKTHISRSAGVISTPTDLDKESPQVFLSSQQFFDDGGVIIQTDPNESSDTTDRLFKSCRLNKNETIISPVEKSRNLPHQSSKHHQLKTSHENDAEDYLSSSVIQKKHPHTSPFCLHYLEESGLGYKCKSQTNIPLRQHSVGLLPDQQLQFDNTESCKGNRHQSNEHFQQYSSSVIKPNPVHYDDNNDEVENNEGDEDEEDNIPYESNTDDVTSDEINRFTFKASHFYLSSNDNLKQCTERPFNSDNLSTRTHESSSVSSENEDEDEDEEEEYDDDEEGEEEEEEDYTDNNVANNQCIYEEDASENKDGSQLDDNEEESEKQFGNQRQNEKQEPLKQSLKISHEELHSQSSSSPNHTSADIRELYFKVQQISEHKNIPANYTFKQNKSIYDAYWNCPRVEPIVGRKSETDGFWTYGHGSTSEKATESNETST